MKKLALGLAILFAGTTTCGQTYPAVNIRSLTIGDSVPDIEFTSLINHSGKTARLSDFKDKNIILDFWSTWCTPCIQLFPELDNLQKEFKEGLVIIAVTRQKREQVEAFFKKRPAIKNVNFYFATDAADLIKWFPHGAIPHDVWINKNRQVQAITSEEYITPSNVKAFVNNQIFPFIHKDENLSYNYEKSIQENGLTLNGSQVLERTVFYGQIPGLRATQSLYKRDTGYFLTHINQPLLQLYRYAIPGKLNNFYRQYILEAQPIENFVYNAQLPQNYDEWKQGHTFGYQVTNRHMISDSAIKAKMLRDLNDHFGLNGRLEKRVCTLYKLIYTGKGKKALKSSGKRSALDWAEKDAHKNLYNKTIATFIGFLNGNSTQRKDIFEFSDETNIPYNIDIELTLTDIGDIDKLRTQLKTYGLVLEMEEREREVFVLGGR